MSRTHHSNPRFGCYGRRSAKRALQRESVRKVRRERRTAGFDPDTYLTPKHPHDLAWRLG